MKLQGKKTGAFANFVGYIDQATPTIDLPTGNTMLTVRYMDAGVNCYKDYKTIAEFNKDWEDYEPIEPLITDTTIRKAVQAWAEANHYENDKLTVYLDHDAISFYNEDDDDNEITFNTVEKFGLEHLKCYTVVELCGKEQE